MSALFIFEIKSTKKDKILNLLNGRFSVNLNLMGGPIDMIFGVFSETYMKLPKIVTSQFFSRHSKCYNNLNVKSCSILNGP